MYGIPGTAILLINSYLSNRNSVSRMSDVSPVNVRVPHGPVLGSLLFNILMYAISHDMKNVFFADDTVFYAESVHFMNYL